MYLQTIAEDEATGRIAEIYGKLKTPNGVVMEATKCFTARPDLLPLYIDFTDKVRAGFSLGPREWRLITLIAAKRVPSTYCSYVFSKQLIDDLGSKEAVLKVQRNFRSAGLSGKDVEMLAYAEKIAQNASQVSRDDIDRLRVVVLPTSRFAISRSVPRGVASSLVSSMRRVLVPSQNSSTATLNSGQP